MQANTSGIEILIASSQKHGAFDSTFPYQRGPEPPERTLPRGARAEKSRRKYTHVAYLLSNSSGRLAATPDSPALPTNERKQRELPAAITALEKKLANKKEGLAMNGQTQMRHQVDVVPDRGRVTNHPRSIYILYF